MHQHSAATVNGESLQGVGEFFTCSVLISPVEIILPQPDLNTYIENIAINFY